MKSEQAFPWLKLRRVPGVGDILAKRLIVAFTTPEAVFSASEEALWATEGISEGVAKSILTFDGADEIKREIEKIDKEGVTLLGLTDPDYPRLLSMIDDPPLLLYRKGIPMDPDSYPVAIVGTRHMTPYGKSVTERMTEGLVQSGMTIVSGFARGIDAVAHQAALNGEGKTVAVLGCGVDRVYPPEHRKLYDRIVEQGTFFSEFPMGATPEPYNFPQRNRTLSGMSHGCVVIEAARKSGALITARFALEQGREVFAVPGSIFAETSRGTHFLLQSGAKLIENAEDIISELRPQWQKHKATAESTKPALVLVGDEEKLYHLLSLEPKHIDTLIDESSLEPANVSHRLLELELKGIIRQLVGQNYIRV